jgi:adenylate kinase family enzyme
MNIVDAYIKFNSQLIILISGFSGSGKTVLARNIQRDFKLDFLNLNDFYRDDFNEVVDLGNNIKVVDWDNPESIDWNKFNMKVNLNKSKGIVISGFGFPKNKIDFKPDFHIRIDIPKPLLLDLRHKYLEENKDNKLNEFKDSETEKLILNKLSYGHYLRIKENSEYTYVYNLYGLSEEESVNLDKITEKTYDVIFDYIIKEIEKNVYKPKQKSISRQKKYKSSKK